MTQLVCNYITCDLSYLFICQITRWNKHWQSRQYINLEVLQSLSLKLSMRGAENEAWYMNELNNIYTKVSFFTIQQIWLISWAIQWVNYFITIIFPLWLELLVHLSDNSVKQTLTVFKWTLKFFKVWNQLVNNSSCKWSLIYERTKRIKNILILSSHYFPS